MKNAIKFSIASVIVTLATLALVAGSAVAQPKISGGVGAGFGQLSWSNADTSSSTYNAQTEANLVASGTNGSFDYYFRIRIRGTQGDTSVKGGTEASMSDGQLQTVRTRVTWNINDSMSLAMGRLPGIGVINPGYAAALRAPSGLRSSDGNIAGWDTGGMVFAYKAGAIRAGLALLARCQVDFPSGCSNINDTSAGGDAVVSNESSMIPFVQYKSGAIGVGVRMAMDSAEVNGTDFEEEAISGSGTNLDFSFKTDAFGIGLEYFTGTKAGTANSLDANNDTEDENLYAIVARIDVAGVVLGYSEGGVVDGITDTAGDAKANASTIVTSVNYPMDMGGGKLTPELISSHENSGNKSGQLIRVVLSTGF
jgi:hypothetical protein